MARAATTAASTSTRRTPTSSTRSTRRATSPPMAARRSPASGGHGGDDPQQMWIDPTDSKRMLVGFDQGAIVTLDGGATWSSWYNQSTEQIYHLSTDNSYPVLDLRVRSRTPAPSARGSAATSARSLRWTGVPCRDGSGARSSPDPLDPNVVYASGNGIVKITYPSEQWIDVSPGSIPSLGLRQGDLASRSCGRRGTSASCSRDSSISWPRPTVACTGAS